MIEYRLIRSDRRTLSISVDREGALVVRAPKRVSRQEIEAFISSRQEWINRQRQAVSQAFAQVPLLEEGSALPFWGSTLIITFRNVSKAVCQEGMLWLPGTGDPVQHARKWRMQQAASLITPRVEYWAAQTGLRPQKTAYGNARTRWGSMNARTRSLRLNAALVHLPQELVDYVIVHELVHILHPDHSSAFHAAVRRVLPDADQRRKALKGYACLVQMWS